MIRAVEKAKIWYGVGSPLYASTKLDTPTELDTPIEMQVSLRDFLKPHGLIVDADLTLLSKTVFPDAVDAMDNLNVSYTVGELLRLRFLDDYLDIPHLRFIYRNWSTMSIEEKHRLLCDVWRSGNPKISVIYFNSTLIKLTARQGALSMLQWLDLNGWFGQLRPVSEFRLSATIGANRPTLMESAALSGDIPTVAWLHKKLCKCTERHTRQKRAQVYPKHTNCPLQTIVFQRAVESSHKPLVNWLLDNGCHWDDLSTLSALNAGDVELFHWFAERGGDVTFFIVIVQAMRLNNLPLVKWIYERNVANQTDYGVLSTSLFVTAVEVDNFAAVEWLLSVQCPVDQSACSAAARMGNLPMLRKLRASNCPWTVGVYNSAAVQGHLHIIQWAYQNGCPKDPSAFRTAIRFQQAHVVRWMLDNDFPHDRFVGLEAMLYDQPYVVAQLHQKNLFCRCPWNGWGCQWNPRTPKPQWAALQWDAHHCRFTGPQRI